MPQLATGGLTRSAGVCRQLNTPFKVFELQQDRSGWFLKYESDCINFKLYNVKKKTSRKLRDLLQGCPCNFWTWSYMRGKAYQWTETLASI
ncbi:hypothetical protein ACFX2I_012890 [Malus domestica]